MANHQPATAPNPSGSPVLGGKPSRSTRFTTNPRGVTLVGTLDYSLSLRYRYRYANTRVGTRETLARARALAGGNLPSGRLRAGSPPITNH
ncbi:MAG: hypothetical protein ACHBN1_12705 [Heteroscytonema crispum UTEX LB 1556]